MAADTILLELGKFVLTQLGSIVIEEVKSLLGAEDELDRMKSNLSSIQAVLKDAEKQQSTSESIKNWIGKLQDVMYDIDDLLDGIATEVRIQDYNKGEYRRQVCKFFSRTNFVVLKYKWFVQIKKLCKKLDQIASERNSFVLSTEHVDLYPSESSSRETHSKVDRSEVILGRDQDKEDIINSILRCEDSETLSVFPIVGFGGLGKTTLVKLIYNDSRIDDNFEIKLWIHISEKFDLKKVLKKLISTATGEKSTNELLSLEQLRMEISKVLKDMKYFLVLDDLWNEDSNEWRKLRGLLDVGAKGSMAIVTTRDSTVASIVQTVEDAYELRELSHETCLEIFKRLAFKDGRKIGPSWLDLANKIVEKSRGVPFVVTALGNLLCGETDEKEWLRVIHKLEQGHEDILKILKLSYDQLPSYFKLCFRICSIYRKGNKLISFHICSLWMALGFIQEEALASRCIKELLSKSLFREGDNIGFLDMFCDYIMHDFVYGLAKSVAGEELVIIEDRKNQEVFEKVRYIRLDDVDVMRKRQVYERLLNQAKKARYFRVTLNSLSKVFLKSLVSNLKCLRALDLSDCQFESLPRSIGYMKHLRFMNLAGNEMITLLPNSICNLINLQYLNLLGCTNLQELPADIGRLKNLKFLSVTTNQEVLPESIGLINGLRLLLIVDCPRLAFLPMSITHLENLDTLYINDCRAMDLGNGRWSLEGLNSLRLLTIIGLPKFQKFTVGDKDLSFTSLQSLHFNSCQCLIELADGLKYLTSLKTLALSNCRNITGLPHTLSNMNNLQNLLIKDCPILRERCTPDKGDDWRLISNISYIEIDGQVIKYDTKST